MRYAWRGDLPARSRLDQVDVKNSAALVIPDQMVIGDLRELHPEAIQLGDHLPFRPLPDRLLGYRGDDLAERLLHRVHHLGELHARERRRVMLEPEKRSAA